MLIWGHSEQKPPPNAADPNYGSSSSQQRETALRAASLASQSLSPPHTRLYLGGTEPLFLMSLAPMRHLPQPDALEWPRTPSARKAPRIRV